MSIHCQCFELLYHSNKFNDVGGSVRITSNFSVKKGSIGKICHLKVVNVYSIQKHKEDIEAFIDELRDIGCIECAVTECVNKCACDTKTNPGGLRDPDSSVLHQLTAFSELMGLMFGKQYVALCRVSIEEEESTPFHVARNQASSEVVVKRPKPTVHYGILVNGRVNSKGTLLVDTLNKVTPLFVRSASPMMVGGSSSSSALLSPVLAEERSVDSANSSDSLEGHTAFQKLCKNWLTIGRITLSRKSPQSSPAQLTLTSKKTFAVGGVGSSSSTSNTPVTQMSQLPSGRHVAKVSSAESTSHRLSRGGSIYSGNVVTSSGGSSASVLTQSKISPSVPVGAGNSGSNGNSNSRKQLNLVTKLRTSLPPRNSRGLQALQSQLRADSPDVVIGSMGDARQAVPRPKNDFLQTIRRSGSFTSNSGGLDLLASPATFSAGDSTPGTDTTPRLQSHFAGPSNSSPLLTPADSIASTVMPMETDCSAGYFTDNDVNDANDFHDAHNSDAGNINSLRVARNNSRGTMMHNTSSSSVGAPPLTSKALAMLPHSFAAASSNTSSSQFITPKKFAHSHQVTSQRGIAMEATLSGSPRDDQDQGEDEEATLRAMAASEADVDMSINDADISFLNKMGFSGDVSPIFGSAALSTPLSAGSFSPCGRSMDALNANSLVADNITSGGDSEQVLLLRSPTRGEWRYSGKEEVNEEYTRDADDETNTRLSVQECTGAVAHLNKSLDMNRTQQKRKKSKRDRNDREIAENEEQKVEGVVEGEDSEVVVAKEDKRRSRRRITPIAVLDVPLLRYGDAALSSQSSVSGSIEPAAPLFSAAVPCELSNMYVSASSAPSSGSRSAGGTSSRILRSQSSLSHGGGTKRGLSQSSATSSGSSAGKNLFGGVFGSMIANAPRLSEVNCKSSSTSGSTSSRSGGSSSGGSGGVHSSGSLLTASESNSRFTRTHQSPETLASRIDASSVCGAAAASSLLSAAEATCSNILLPVETTETGADGAEEDDNTCATVKEEDLLYQELVAEDPFGGPDSYNTSQVSCSGSLLHLPHLQHQAGSSRSMDIETAGTTLESQSAAGVGAALSNCGTEAAPNSSSTRVLRRRVTSSANVSVVPPADSSDTTANSRRVVLRSRRSLSTNNTSVSDSSIVIRAQEYGHNWSDSNQCDSNTGVFSTEAAEQQMHQQHYVPSVSVDESSRLVFESFLSNNTIPFGLNSAVMPIVQRQQHQQQLPKTGSTLSDSISAAAAVVPVSARSGSSGLDNSLKDEAAATTQGPRDVSTNDNSSAISVAGSELGASGALVAQVDLAEETKAEQTSAAATALSEYQTALNKLPASISSLLGDCVLRRLTHPVACALQLVRQLMSLSAAAAEKMLGKLDSTPNDKSSSSSSSSSSVSKSSGKPNDKPRKGNQSTSSKKSGSGSGGGSAADKRLCCDAIVAHLCKHLLSMLKKIRIGGLSQGAAAYSALCVILAVFPTHYYCELLSRSKQSSSSSSGNGGASTGTGVAVLKKLKSFASYAGAFETAMGRCKLALGSWCLVDADKLWILTLPAGNTSDSAAVTVSGTDQNRVSKDKRKRSVDNLNNTIVKSSSDAAAGQPTSTPSGPSMQVLIDFLKASYAPCTALYDRIKESIRTRDVAQLLLDTPVKAARPAKKARGGGGGLGGVDEEVEKLFAEVADGTSGEGVAASLGGALLMENASNNSQSSQNTQQSVLLHDNYVVSEDVAPDTTLTTAAAAAGTMAAGNVHISSVGTRSSVSVANLLPTGTTTSSGGSLSALNSLGSNTTNTATSAVLPGMKSSLKRTNSILGESGSRRHVNHRMQMGEQKRVSVANPASITSAHHKVASNLLSHTKTNSVGNSTNNSNSSDSNSSSKSNSNTLSSPVRSSSRHADNRQFSSASLLSPSVVFDTQMSPGTVRRSGSNVNCVADTPFEQQGGGYRKKRPVTADKSSSSSFKKSPLFSPGMMSSPLTASADRAAEQQHMVFGSPKFEQDLDAEEESDQQLHSAAGGKNAAAKRSERSALFDENEAEHLSARKKQRTTPLPTGDSGKPVVKSVAKSAAIPIRVPIKVPAKRLHGGGGGRSDTSAGNSSPLPVKIAAPVLPLLPSGRKRGQHAGLKELVSLAPSSQSSSSNSGGELSQLSQTLSLSVTPGRCTRSQRGIAELSPQGTTPGAVSANTPINTSTDTLGHTPSGTSTTPSCRLTRSASKLEIGCSPPLQPTPLTTDSSVGGVYSSVNSNASTSVGGSVSIDIVRSPVVPSLDTQSPPPTSPHSARSSNHTSSACNNSMLPPAPKKKARSPDYLLSNSAAVAAADPQMQPPSSGLRPPMGRRKPGF